MKAWKEGDTNPKIKSRTFSLSEKRALLLRYDFMCEECKDDEIEHALGVGIALLRQWKKKEDELFSVPGPWQDTVGGKTWKDMPGADAFSRRCNFYLFRTGRLRLEDVGRQPRRRRTKS